MTYTPCSWPCPGPHSGLQFSGTQDHPKAHCQPDLRDNRLSLTHLCIRVCSISSAQPRSRVYHSLQRIFIYNAKKIINHFWTVLRSVKQLVKNVATPLQEVLVCADLLGTVCVVQGAGSVCVQKKASPWHPDGHHHGPGVSKNV